MGLLVGGQQAIDLVKNCLEFVDIFRCSQPGAQRTPARWLVLKASHSMTSLEDEDYSTARAITSPFGADKMDGHRCARSFGGIPRA